MTILASEEPDGEFPPEEEMAAVERLVDPVILGAVGRMPADARCGLASAEG